MVITRHDVVYVRSHFLPAFSVAYVRLHLPFVHTGKGPTQECVDPYGSLALLARRSQISPPSSHPRSPQRTPAYMSSLR